ncbi:MAG: ketoacyl-synthetase C-terminal extension domain-containing protein, partial [Candidatus Thiodiazotropha sp.]
MPNPRAQAALIETALARAGVEARSIGYVEAHGTGTALGDPIEVAGLNKAYARHGAERHACALGSVKSNIGHLESGAGIAGLIKILLQLKHRTLVPSLHAETLNPQIDFAVSPFVVQREVAEWKRPRNYPRRAALSSFGAGGANAHAIIEEYEAAPAVVAEAGAQLIVLSARTQERLRAYAQRLEAHLRRRESEGEAAALSAIAYTLQTGREAMEQRLALVVRSIDELIERLHGYLAGESDGLVRGNAQAGGGQAVLEGRAGEAYLRVVLEERDLAKLARLWADGLEIDWALL